MVSNFKNRNNGKNEITMLRSFIRGTRRIPNVYDNRMSKPKQAMEHNILDNNAQNDDNNDNSNQQRE